MLLARQALILHLQHNTPFTIETSIASVWDKHWKEYIDRNIPAFLVLTDAENVPWKKTGETKMLDEAVEFFFRCLLLHCLVSKSLRNDLGLNHFFFCFLGVTFKLLSKLFLKLPI